MAKRNRSITAKTKAMRKREGRGQGHGANYKPELRIQDVSSIGLATRDRGWKTKRIHHLMSKLEWMFFYILEWSPIVSDIREQFPLDLEETLAIAKSLGITHPTDPRTKESVVMTTDFVISLKSRVNTVLHARTIKYANKLSSRRALEKLEIERVYWANRNVDWGIVTELDVDPIVTANIEWIHFHYRSINLSPINKKQIRMVEAYLAPRLISNKEPLRTLTDACDEALALKVGSSMAIVRHLIANRRLQIDMSKPIQPERCLVLIATPTIMLS